MMMSGKTIKAQAIVDMNYWILKFKPSDVFEKLDPVAQQVYQNEIEKLKLRLLKEI